MPKTSKLTRKLPSNMGFTGEQRKFIVASKDEMTVPEIAESIGVAPCTVYNFLWLYKNDPDVVNDEPKRAKGLRMPLREFEKQFIRDNIHTLQMTRIISHLRIAGKTFYDFVREENLKTLDWRRQKLSARSKTENSDDIFVHDKYYLL